MTARRTIFCLLALLPLGAQGSDYQSLASIRAAAEQFALAQGQGQGHVEVTIGALDRRLHLPRCSLPLRAFLPPGSRLQGNTAIGVSCPDARPWKIYVPTRIRLMQRVLVAKRPLIRGERLQAEDLDYAEQDITRLRSGYFTDARNLVGKVLSQAVMPGRVISPRIIDNPRLVRRGQDVTILAGSDGFEIRMKGKAMMDGKAGDVIRVKNSKSKRIVEGQVVAASTVKVPL